MLRTFDNADWDAFAGASNLPDGTEPRIGERDGWTVVVSGNVFDYSDDSTCHVEINLANGQVWGKECISQWNAIAVANMALSMQGFDAARFFLDFEFDRII